MIWPLLQRARPPRRRSRQRHRHQLAHVSLEGQQLEARRLLAVVTMSDQDQLLLELVNRARADPLAEVARAGVSLNEDLEPDEISPDPKQPLAPHQSLIIAAGRHADDMLVREFFEHENPDGKGPSDRARDAGYPRGVGENIAWFGKPGFLERDEEVYRRHEALVVSAPHRTSIMNGSFRELGTAVRYGEFSRLNAVMVAQSFGNRRGDFFITGVAYTDTAIEDDFYSIGESLASIQVVATRYRDGETFRTTTGRSGGYSLEVPFGVYTVTAQGAGITGTMTVENVAMFGGNEKVDFNTRSSNLGSISGVLFDDGDRDGVRDSNDNRLANRVVFVDADNDGIQSLDETMVQTDATGAFRFENLRAGSYAIRQKLPAGWEGTVPAGDKFGIELEAGEVRSAADFGSVIVNNVPVANADSYSTPAGRRVSMDVFANDSDVDGELVLESTQIRTEPEHGTVVLDTNSGTLVYTPDSEFVGDDQFDYAVTDDGGLTSEQARVTITVTPSVGASWQNPNNSLDVNSDTFVSSIDALLILNRINRIGAGPLQFPTDQASPPPYLDVTGDGFVAPLDVLFVLNELNKIAAARRDAAAGEGEPTVNAVPHSSARDSAAVAAAIDAVFNEESPIAPRS